MAAAAAGAAAADSAAAAWLVTEDADLPAAAKAKLAHGGPLEALLANGFVLAHAALSRVNGVGVMFDVGTERRHVADTAEGAAGNMGVARRAMHAIGVEFTEHDIKAIAAGEPGVGAAAVLRLKARAVHH